MPLICYLFNLHFNLIKNLFIIINLALGILLFNLKNFFKWVSYVIYNWNYPFPQGNNNEPNWIKKLFYIFLALIILVSFYYFIFILIWQLKMLIWNKDEIFYDLKFMWEYYLDFKNSNYKIISLILCIHYISKLFVLLLIFSLINFHSYHSLRTLYKIITVYFKFINTIYISEKIRFQKNITTNIKNFLFNISIITICDLLLILWDYLFIHIY